ncbi:MAG: hypothetical protein JRJ35_08320 [Deltaproteobacteria bacterium]|nr:hypothetical protein [Deltaproteobacteria bacterium]MBW1923464.1 hypothetical protein [Deltaproteobacteria bacterium]MBW1949615.1 hypothetical protein [Deltaproteobacteria bacterium]RLB39955.1 MAG: hypothetical protein DRH20_02395 [Deltaproteobacteria bacterium]RLB39971.1 MAG: hypothetical protein DRH20_02480 [Deltaproteobacteria bacterium]
MGAVVAGLVGNAILNPPYLAVLLEYFVPVMLLVAIMLGRITILEACLFLVRTTLMSAIKHMTAISQWIRAKIEEINSQQIVFFTRGDNLANLNRAMLYVQQNEHTNRIKIVTVVRSEDEVPPNLKHDLDFLNQAYPNIEIEFVVLTGVFSPELVQKLSEEWKIPTNLMFIGSPGTHFIYGLADFGGVRLII